MRRKVVLFLLLFSCYSIIAQITLTHNVGNTPIQTDMRSCEFTQSWARTFTLSDFGVLNNDKFIINSGQVAIYNSLGGSKVQFNIYKIDNNFPNSYSTTDLIGSSQVVDIPVIGDIPEIIQVNFDTPVVVPREVERVLVEVRKFFDINNWDESLAYIAGTQFDNDVSWFWGCNEVYSHTATESLNPPVNNANFFINVTGEIISTENLGFDNILTHNLCDDVVKVNQYSCSGGGLKYARTFILEDFGVSENEEFIIDRGQVAFSSVGGYGAKIQFNIYKIDDNFPTSYSETDLIGSSQIINIPYFGSGNSVQPKIFEVFFGTPVVVPANVDKILVEVFNLANAGSSGHVFIAGGAQSNDLSWLRSESGGCTPFQEYIAITDPSINYFIKVTGNASHITDNFEMNISNICSEFLKEFSIENKANVSSVVWDFGDPSSGATNVSTDLSPFHDFSADGTYTVTATVTANSGVVEVLTETIQVKEPPNAYGINNIIACEDNFNTGFSSTFDTSNVLSQVLGGQTNKTVTFIDGSGNEYNVLPNPFTNTVKDRETITVRIARNDELCCYSETTFDLIVNPLPNLSSIEDLQECDDDTDGFAFFDLSNIETNIVSSNANNTVEFYHENGTQILGNINTVRNQVQNEETITIRVLNNLTNCYSETKLKLIVNPLPIAHSLSDIVGCDDNSDGISEYFDMTNIESTVLGGQNGMEVSYFDASGNALPNPLPNPYINSTPNQEIITVRVTNNNTQCFSETQLRLITSEKPSINKPTDKYACDEGGGISTFDLSSLESEVIGNQNNLKVYYFNSSGDDISNLISSNYNNSLPWNETITVKIENAFSAMCISETSFNLIVNTLPEVNIEESYFLCNLEPSLSISVNPNLNSWEWKYEDGTIVSNSFEANIVKAGNYSLIVTEISNGIKCEKTFNFELIRSVLPTIQEVELQELSDNNYIKIIASGDGDFEYSIDGNAFQDSHEFHNVLGGVYTVYVRDKYGCGSDQKVITLIDYPKFFTPNNDGINDYWQIQGINTYPNSKILIFDRYGKLIKELSSSDKGWNGLYKGRPAASSDYWFKVNLNNETTFSGHFTLKR